MPSASSQRPLLRVLGRQNRCGSTGQPGRDGWSGSCRSKGAYGRAASDATRDSRKWASRQGTKRAESVRVPPFMITGSVSFPVSCLYRGNRKREDQAASLGVYFLFSIFSQPSVLPCFPHFETVPFVTPSFSAIAVALVSPPSTS